MINGQLHTIHFSWYEIWYESRDKNFNEIFDNNSQIWSYPLYLLGYH